MLLISNHLRNFINFTPLNVVRVNMAWYSYEQLCVNLDEIQRLMPSNKVFIDIPHGRVKPPSNRYTFSELAALCQKYSNIKYVAISNVESPEQITKAKQELPDRVIIVPKIETIKGVNNILEIATAMHGERVIMIDHDDLCSDLIKSGISPSRLYADYINPLVINCNENGIKPLRTAGVVFSDE